MKHKSIYNFSLYPKYDIDKFILVYALSKFMNLKQRSRLFYILCGLVGLSVCMIQAQENSLSMVMCCTNGLLEGPKRALKIPLIILKYNKNKGGGVVFRFFLHYFW